MTNNSQISNLFSITKFHARYLAGDSSLKQYRQVSRMRLAIAACGVETGDVMAKDLLKTINIYIDGLQILSNTDVYTLDLLKMAHAKLNPSHKKAGKVRTTQTWIGSKYFKDAAYIPPPPIEVPNLLKDLFTLLNDNSVSNLYKAKKSYVVLQNIHPFSDGNGRLSRALFGAILSREQPNYIHHSLFRLGTDPEEYRSAIGGHFESNSLNYPYWQNMDVWVLKYNQELQKIQNKAQRSIQSKFQFCAMNIAELQLVNSLWNYPVVTASWLMKKMQQSFDSANQTIEKFVNLKLLYKQPITTLRGVEFVYLSDDIFSAWQAMDNLIFEDKNTQVNNKLILV